MKTFILSKEQIQQLISDNKYRIDPKTQLLSRCIDDRYQDDVGLSPLALPGADAGELAIIFATANSFGFEIDEKKAFDVLTEIVGGLKNLHFHTDSKNENDPLVGCGYFKQISLDLKTYNLEEKQIDFIHGMVNSAALQGARDDILEGEHLRGAILQISGNWNIYPCYVLQTADGTKRVEFFEFHQTLVDFRHKLIAKKLIVNNAVKLYKDCDDEYLYQAISETTEQHFFETVKRLAPGLPIYSVVFKEDGQFKLEGIGKIENS